MSKLIIYTESGKAISERELSITKRIFARLFFNEDFLKADFHEGLENCTDAPRTI